MDIAPELQSVIDNLEETFGDAIVEVTQPSGDTIVRVSLEKVHDVLTHLKEEHRFIYLVDIIGTDRFTSDDRFEVIYNIVSLKDQTRIFIKTRLPEENPEMQTTTDIWPAANWYEREVYDMFGVKFKEHPDLRRVFLPEDFDYHPLRKEFPLLGIPGSIELPNTTPDTE